MRMRMRIAFLCVLIPPLVMIYRISPGLTSLFYALFQSVRNTKGFNLIYYYIQWILFRDHKRSSTIVWVNKHYSSRRWQDIQGWLPVDGTWPQQNLLNKTKNGIDFLDWKLCWYNMRLRGKYYWVHQDAVAKLYQYDFQDCIFVKDLYDLSQKYSVAQRISSHQALLLIFNMDMHFQEVDQNARTVIYGREIHNVEFNSKLGGFLAAVPLFFQARGWDHSSAIASLILLIIDILRSPLYELYDWTFFQITKYVKLYVFGHYSLPYDFFGLFSNRWKYSNKDKGHAYFMKPNETVEVSSYVSYLEPGQCEVIDLGEYESLMITLPHYIIRDSVVSLGPPNYDRFTVVIRVQKGIYFS